MQWKHKARPVGIGILFTNHEKVARKIICIALGVAQSWFSLANSISKMEL